VAFSNRNIEVKWRIYDQPFSTEKYDNKNWHLA